MSCLLEGFQVLTMEVITPPSSAVAAPDFMDVAEATSDWPSAQHCMHIKKMSIAHMEEYREQ